LPRDDELTEALKQEAGNAGKEEKELEAGKAGMWEGTWSVAV
jgi:hypothetical protein